MADIGDKLRSAREDKGLSIADVEKATKIQSRYLTAIEQNDFDKLPGDFYTRAFIRQYAQVVGLDGKELLSEFHQAVPESKPDQYVENSIDNKSEEVKETTDNKKNLWRNYLPRIGVILGIIVVILIVYVLYARLSSGGQGNNNANSNVSVSSQSSSSAKSKKAVKKSHVRIIKLGAGQYRILGLSSNRRLEVRAGNQAINASVTVNGVSQWQQQLAANQRRSMILPSNARTVAITFSNDNATSVRIAGKRIPYAPTGSSLTIRLYIGKAAKSRTSTNSNSSSSNSSTGTTVNNNNSNSQSRQSQASSQSSRTQSANTQSRSQNNQTRTQQSSQTSQNNQSSSTTTSTGSTGD